MRATFWKVTGEGADQSRGLMLNRCWLVHRGKLGFCLYRLWQTGAAPSRTVAEAFARAERKGWSSSSECVPSREIRHIIDWAKALRRIHSELAALSSSLLQHFSPILITIWWYVLCHFGQCLLYNGAFYGPRIILTYCRNLCFYQKMYKKTPETTCFMTLTDDTKWNPKKKKKKK